MLRALMIASPTHSGCFLRGRRSQQDLTALRPIMNHGVDKRPPPKGPPMYRNSHI